MAAQEPVRPNWLVIAPDSLRADRVGASADGRVVAPLMSALADEGVRFDNAFSQSGWTTPALASLLSGQYPTVLQGNGSASAVHWLPGERTLPEILTLYGYRTAAFWGVSVPSGIPAFNRGFDEVFVRDPRESPRDGVTFDAWVQQAPEPFFVLLHEVDFSSRITPPSPVPDQAEAARIYDGMVRDYDATLAYARDALRARGLDDHTVIVVTSAHGVDLFEHDDYVSHGTLYDTTLRVPLVWCDPGLHRPSPRLDTIVQGIDLAPSVLERSGIPADLAMDGQSLLPLLGMGEGAYEQREVLGGASMVDASLRTGRHKLISCRSDCCGGTGPNPSERVCRGEIVQKLFDLQEDPGELHDLADQEPVLTAELNARLQARLRALGREHGGGEASEIDPETRRMLQERGYWGLLFPEEGGPVEP